MFFCLFFCDYWCFNWALIILYYIIFCIKSQLRDGGILTGFLQNFGLWGIIIISRITAVLSIHRYGNGKENL